MGGPDAIVGQFEKLVSRNKRAASCTSPGVFVLCITNGAGFVYLLTR